MRKESVETYGGVLASWKLGVSSAGCLQWLRLRSHGGRDLLDIGFVCFILLQTTSHKRSRKRYQNFELYVMFYISTLQ